MNSYEALLQACDSDIRSGRPQDVAKRLAHIEPARVPRVWRLPLAKICRRAGLYSRGLALLTRIVLASSGRPRSAASHSEIAEYAALLLRCGAIGEAEEFLRTVDTNVAPDALLYRSYIHFLRWEYLEAIPQLEQYVGGQLTPYARLVGQTNLAYALVESKQHEPALNLLEDLTRSTRAEGHRLLECHCRVYRAQVYFNQGDISRAKAELEEAKSFFKLAETNDHLIIAKWDLIFEGISTQDVLPFERLRELAIEHRNWEALRDADFYSLRVRFDKERLLHLYFGTPFPRFRELIRNEFEVPDRDIYILGPKFAPRLDIRTGEIDGHLALNPGGKCHQLLEVLLRDFYQPMRIPSIFSSLFPNEHFNIGTSPDRIRKIIRRARRWLLDQGVPVRIKTSDGFYSLVLEGKFSIRVPLEKSQIELPSLQFAKLERAFRQSPAFSARHARETLGWSKSAVQRLINWGIENQRIEKLGDSNRDALYRLTLPNRSQKLAA